jgi:tellurite resistance protein TerC
MLFKTLRKVLVAVVGGTVVFIGLVMIVTPGPALLIIPAGLAILATEFVFARRLLKKAKEGARAVGERAGMISRPRRDPQQPDAPGAAGGAQ